MTLVVLQAVLRRPRPCTHSKISASHAFRHGNPPRAIHTTHPLQTPDRPTTLTNMLASDVPPPVQVSSVGPAGIKLADGLVLTGPVIFLEGKVLLWDAPMVGGGKEHGTESWSWDGWTRTHWEVFDVVVPKPEILIFGTGARMQLAPSSIRDYMKKLGIQMDVMDTKNACSTYNLLAEEGRRVAAALLPIRPKRWTKK